MDPLLGLHLAKVTRVKILSDIHTCTDFQPDTSYARKYLKMIILWFVRYTVKPALSGHSKRRPKLVYKTDFRLMQLKSIAECSMRAFSNNFGLSALKSFVLYTFDWPLKIGFTELQTSFKL